MKNKNSVLAEGSASNSQSILQLSDQVKKFVLKYKDSPMVAINSLSIGLFLGMSEAFAEDGDSSTNGLNMLDKVIIKMKALAKEYGDVVPQEGEDFNLEDGEVEDMETTLDDESEEDDMDLDTDENDGDEDEYDTDDLEDEEDNEDKELNMNDEGSDEDEEDEEDEDEVPPKKGGKPF